MKPGTLIFSFILAVLIAPWVAVAVIFLVSFTGLPMQTWVMVAFAIVAFAGTWAMAYEKISEAMGG